MAELSNKKHNKTIEELVSAIVKARVSPKESLSRSGAAEKELDLEKANVKLTYENRLIKRRNRKIWNYTLLSLVVLGFLTSYVMIFLIGFGVMKFDNNVFAIPAVVAAGVLETYGLAKLAIAYFFNDNDALD